MAISLLELGLNKYEERVYLTLVEEGVSSAKNISDITGIPYGKVYEVLNNLSGKGFLTILPTKPMKFQAVSPKEAIINTKKNMHEKFEQLESQMIEELEPVFARTKKFSEPKNMFWVINGRSNVNNKIEEFIKKAKSNISIITSKNGLKRLVMFMDLLKSATRRGVKIKINATLTSENKQDAKNLEFCDLTNIGRAHNHFFSVDNSECLIIDPIADDENLVQGRDIGMWIMSSSFTKFIDDLVHNPINSSEFDAKR